MSGAAPDGPADLDYLVIGGGFYGCCLALFLGSVSDRIMLAEAGPRIMDRASRVNQARIHTGFHYPRSPLTAVKSLSLHRRFAQDFPDAVVDRFQMLYAIARRRSKVSAKRFFRMFDDLGAPIRQASPSQAALFDPDTIEAVFACTEWAFDCDTLRRHIANRLDAAPVDLRLGTRVEALERRGAGYLARLSSGAEVTARYVFNVTYAQTNDILSRAGLPPAQLKYELTELVLIEPPEELQPYGITVMDGPFFSAMPYPSEELHSLTHVRYTPHRSWTDAPAGSPAGSPYEIFRQASPESRFRHMILDSQRYVPALAGARYRRSIYDVKAILTKNERDDGRPILYQRRPQDSPLISILGGKIDNIYDLFDLVRQTEPEFAAATGARLLGGPG